MIGNNLVNIVSSSIEKQFNLLNHQWIQGTSRGFILLRSEKTKSPIYRVQGQVEHICTTWWRRMVYPPWRVARAKTTISRALHCSTNLIFFPPSPSPFSHPLLQGIFSTKILLFELLLDYLFPSKILGENGGKKWWTFYDRSLREKF